MPSCALFKNFGHTYLVVETTNSKVVSVTSPVEVVIELVMVKLVVPAGTVDITVLVALLVKVPGSTDTPVVFVVHVDATIVCVGGRKL